MLSIWNVLLHRMLACDRVRIKKVNEGENLRENKTLGSLRFFIEQWMTLSTHTVNYTRTSDAAVRRPIQTKRKGTKWTLKGKILLLDVAKNRKHGLIGCYTSLCSFLPDIPLLVKLDWSLNSANHESSVLWARFRKWCRIFNLSQR